MKNKKVILSIFLLAILVVGVGIVTLTIRNNTALQNSEAAGFGSSATTTNLRFVERTLAFTACPEFLSQKNLNTLPSNNRLTITKIDSQPSQNLIPTICSYSLSNNKQIVLTVHAYNKSSFIDKSQLDLFKRINGLNLGRVINDKVTTAGIHFFYGTDKANSAICRVNIYHPINDFEYATLTYSGFQNCNDLTTNNAIISDALGINISKIIAGYNSPF